MHLYLQYLYLSVRLTASLLVYLPAALSVYLPVCLSASLIFPSRYL